MSLQTLQGDCRDTLATIPTGTVQMCVTSPPYWGLRSYLPKGHPDKHREIGQEKTPDCGRPMMKLRDDLTDSQREFVIRKLQEAGFNL